MADRELDQQLDQGSDQDARPETAALYRLDALDPHGRLVDRTELGPEDIDQLDRLMAATARLGGVERRLAEQSQRYMRLNATDMRALQFLIVAANRGEPVTPGDLGRYLGIASASTTKMLDRLEAAGHITRSPHPTDRRSTAVSVDPRTRETATDTVGRVQARRYAAAAALDPAERETVIRFLEGTADALAGAADPAPLPPALH